MPPTQALIERPRGTSFAGELVLAPPSARGTPWMRRLGDLSDALASGLMRVRGVRRQRAYDRGFVLSDHADWPALLDTIADDRRRARAGHARPRRAAGALPARAGPRRRRHPHARGKTKAARTTTNEARSPRSSPRSTARRRPTPRSRRWSRYFAAAPAGRRGVGGVLPHRPAAEAAAALPRDLRTGRWRSTGLDEWLLGECYAVVGDGAETATLILDQLPPVAGEPLSLAEWVEGRILPLRQAPPDAQQRQVIGWIRELDAVGALHAVQAADRRAAPRRLADAGRARRGPGGVAAGHVDRRPAHGRVDAVGGVVRRAGRRPASPTPTARGRIRSAWPRRSTTRSPMRRRSRRCSASAPTGRSNGSGTASAPSWSCAAAASTCGRAAKS